MRAASLAWMLAVAPLSAVAAPAAPPVEGAAAAEADAHELLLRSLRRAERELFEHNDRERYLAVFAPSAVWIEGRRAVADEHDVRFDRATRATQLERLHRIGSTGHEQVFFRDTEVEPDGKRLVVSTTLRRGGFNGADTVRQRYVLESVGGEWKVVEVRRWPLRDISQGVAIVYDDERWLSLDEAADKALADDAVSTLAKVNALLSAHRTGQALEVARAATQKAPRVAETWRLRAELALTVGRLDESRTAADKAKALDPATPLPPTLQ